MWCLFHPDVVGTRQDRIVRVEDLTKFGIDRYSLKKYHSEKDYHKDGTWEHSKIYLLSLNREHLRILLEPDGNYRIAGWFVGALSRIHRI